MAWGSSLLRLTAALIASAALAAFVFFVATKIQAKGVCCADDAFIAHVAKNLARGQGYAAALQHDSAHWALQLFDPMISTGAPLVLPAAALVTLFGNAGWVPGTTVLLVTVLLLLALRFSLASQLDGTRLDLAAPVFLALCVALTAFHLEHWYALLGEVPAALLVVLACMLPATRVRTAAASGLLLGLAFLTKTLAALYAVVFFVALAAARPPLAKRPAGRESRALLVAAVVGCAVPVLAFELWKLLLLGASDYVRSWWRFGAAAGSLAAPGGGHMLATRIAEGSAAFYARFGFSLFELNAFNWVAVLVVQRFTSSRVALSAAALAAGVSLQSIWWLTTSNVWPRYMVMGLVVTAFLAVLPLVCLPRIRWVAVYAALLAVWSVGLWPRTVAQVRDVDATARINLDRTLAFLQNRPEVQPYVAQWWATVADLEYRLPAAANFRGFRSLSEDDWRRSFLVVVNDAFVFKGDVAFEQLLAQCGPPVYAAPPYRVHRCGGSS